MKESSMFYKIRNILLILLSFVLTSVEAKAQGVVSLSEEAMFEDELDTALETPADSKTAIEQVEQLEQADKAAPRKTRILSSFKTKNGESLSNSSATEILLFGVVLMAITAIVAGLLAFIHAQTAPIIEQHESEKRQIALQEIFPQADNFVDALTQTQDDFAFSDTNVSSVYLVYQNNEIVGYCVSVSSTGYSSTPIELMVGSDLLNKVTAIKVVNHSETPGIGETVISENQQFFEQFTGQSRPIEYSNQITAVSGATFTSDGIKNGVNAALAAVDEVRLNMAQAGEGE
jgi:electron transport complex protein RnfG